MKVARALICIGIVGITISLLPIVHAQLPGTGPGTGPGPCGVYLGGGCWCSYQSTDNGDGNGAYWYFCDGYQIGVSACQNLGGACRILNPYKCFTNFSTPRVKCTGDFGPCAIGCAVIDSQCQTMGTKCY